MEKVGNTRYYKYIFIADCIISFPQLYTSLNVLLIYILIEVHSFCALVPSYKCIIRMRRLHGVTNIPDCLKTR
jgi:hypothetical protein